ncbi:DUF4041 domain-containing protein [Amycolatopsis rhabdoformis]|uniref:DUF4041 domain-containing protein n=1 Tax=Amycolatopsis rhabdoformis TaxID=1448059 RepID=A0ABZ1ID42_9PSEU|nr:DUF4041 domain-containing protein [Amycolatopsis rhabdoformis]WSE32068.1 DUF4041 domain-containing protein [Amycolatopsis rhabdoformis]
MESELATALEALRSENGKAQQLTAQLQETAARNDALKAKLADLNSRYTELRGADALALEQEIRQLRRTVDQLRAESQDQRTAQAQQQKAAEAELAAVRRQLAEEAEKLTRVRAEVVETQEIALLQEAGIYEFRHRLADAVAYKAALQKLKDSVKVAAKNNHAITATTDWTVNGSAVEGQRMVRDFSKLMLRAYNAEADNCVRSMRPYRLDSALDRLTKTRDVISRLGKTMNINISPGYHRLRLEELELTADHLAKVEEEKERIRAERERQRDEQQAQREFEREKSRLNKEQAHWRNALQKWAESGDGQQAEAARAKLDEIDEAIRGVEEREANIRTGWVYVISNVGSFGDGVVKIGLTRRLDPLERVRELGDASVPFRFDVHAKIFDADAVSLETRLHQRLADRRVNRVNLRREFFYATPAEILQELEAMGLRDNLLDYVEEAEAQEWRSSRQLARDAAPASPAPAA